MKNKGILIAAIVSIVVLLGGIGYLFYTLRAQQQDNEDLKELAALDKREMENEYAQFALQYDELKRSIKNDSLSAQLSKEQRRAQELLEELRRVKSTDAAEITRLKRELETVRAVLRSYIVQVDSLSRLNQALQTENQEVKARYDNATTQITHLTTEKKNLSETVKLAAQLDATGIMLSPQNKRGKDEKKTKDITRFVISFTITKNITAQTGERTIYVRLTKPNNEVVNQSGTFAYENRSLGYSALKTIAYNGEEQGVTVYVPVGEFLSPGDFTVYLFSDGTMIGSRSLTISK